MAPHKERKQKKCQLFFLVKLKKALMKGNYRERRRYELEKRGEREKQIAGLTNRMTCEGKAPCWMGLLRCRIDSAIMKLLPSKKDRCAKDTKQLCWKTKANLTTYLQLTWKLANNHVVQLFFFWFFQRQSRTEKAHNDLKQKLHLNVMLVELLSFLFMS